jgi:Zn-dependent alcohol dehydrogenase
MLVIGERTIKGSLYGSADPARDFPWILDLYREGKLDLDSLITQTLPLDGVNDALDQMRRGEQLRTMLEM